MLYPYSYFRCPCTDTSTQADLYDAITDQSDVLESEEEHTFDPRAPRSNFSVHPLEHLLWCEDCHDIRCPRCTIEEIVCWYCPSCLFEVPSSMVKSEGNRCTRNCFNCPICTAPMSVNAFDIEGCGTTAGPWILACEHCDWTSLDIDIQFEKPNNIYGQLAKLRQSQTSQMLSSRLNGKGEQVEDRLVQDLDARFGSLKSFYSSQLQRSSSSNPLMTPSGEISHSSPSSLARIMSLYTGLGSYGKKATDKSDIMRESVDPAEGLRVIDTPSEEAVIRKLRDEAWAATTSVSQQGEQPYYPRFLGDVKPVATLLCTKRSKRCRTCRHILVKPEAKVQSTRFRIKLVAANYVPSVVIRPLEISPPTSVPNTALSVLPSMKASQFLLTLKNPMFDPVRITLATPSLTPGRFKSKVTILCPQFEIGANTDLFDEALSGGDGKSRGTKSSKTKGETAGNEGKVAEAGKVWDKGRNWTTIVVEVVCAAIDVEDEDLEEDEDVLELPVFVRVEYEADAAGDDGGVSAEKDKREKRELAYWCVLGVGKIARLGSTQ